MRNELRFKCLVIGPQRSGSTVLSFTLAQHPEIAMFGELLASPPELRERYVRVGLQYESAKSVSETPPATPEPVDALIEQLTSGRNELGFVRDVLFSGKLCPRARVTGFKMIYRHGWEERRESEVHRYLRCNKEVRIIHLVRHNLLQAWLSRDRAQQTGDFVRFRGGPEPTVNCSPMHCEPAWLQTYFEHIEAWRQRTIKSFGQHPMLTLNYESNIAEGLEAAMDMVQDFLEVPRRRLTPPVEKQPRWTARERLANFEQLRDYFEGTPYRGFFEEN